MILPLPGELNRRASLISVNHTPTGDFELKENRKVVATVWAKFEVIGGSSYWGSVNVEETTTHRIYVRYVNNLTRPQDLKDLVEVECEGINYLVKRCTDVNNAHRFTMLEVEEIRSVGD